MDYQTKILFRKDCDHMKIPISKIVTILLSVTFTYTAIPTIVHAEIYGSATDEFFQNKELVK